MEIVQKKKYNKHTFTFEENHFNFAYEDKRKSRNQWKNQWGQTRLIEVYDRQ